MPQVRLPRIDCIRVTATGILMALLTIPAARATGQEANERLRVLKEHSTKDLLIGGAVRRVQVMLTSILPKISSSQPQVDLLVVDFGEDWPDLYYSYRTDTCQAIRTGLPRPTIICDEQFLKQTEVVIRAFEEAGPLMRYEDSLVAFARAVADRHQEMLTVLRASGTPGATTEHIGLHLQLALLFFASHEIGHLIDREDFQSYAPPPGPPSEAQIQNAVLKMCRHADEFREADFHLPGFDSMLAPGSQARQNEERFRRHNPDDYAETQRRFAAESRADQTALKVVLEHLSELDRMDPGTAALHQHLLLETLFVLGLHQWYRDYSQLHESTCGGFPNSQRFVLCMMQSRTRYVAASKAFGEVHRFIMLRTFLTMQEILRQRTDYFRAPPSKRTIWTTREELLALQPAEQQRKIWLTGDLQRYTLLTIVMDTPLKLSYVGCLTGWMAEEDRRRGSPQLLVMDFEPLEAALQRLVRTP